MSLKMTWSPLMALRDLFVSRAKYRAQTKSSTNVNKSIIIFAAGRAWISHLFCFLLVFLLAFLRSAGGRRGKVFLWVNARPGLGLNDVYNLRQQSHASASRFRFSVVLSSSDDWLSFAEDNGTLTKLSRFLFIDGLSSTQLCYFVRKQRISQSSERRPHVVRDHAGTWSCSNEDGRLRLHVKLLIQTYDGEEVALCN